MKENCKIILIIVLILINKSLVHGQSQEYTKSSMKVGFGLGVILTQNLEGAGLVYTLGYQKEIWKDRLRINPNFSIGHHNSNFILDSNDEYFTSINLETNLYYDLIRIKKFSLVIGCGGFLNNSKGLTILGGNPDGSTAPLTSKYINDVNLGGHVAGGFRINSPEKRTAINIMPINLYVGTDEFLLFSPKIELDFKF